MSLDQVHSSFNLTTDPEANWLLWPNPTSRNPLCIKLPTVTTFTIWNKKRSVTDLQALTMTVLNICPSLKLRWCFEGIYFSPQTEQVRGSSTIIWSLTWRCIVKTDFIYFFPAVIFFECLCVCQWIVQFFHRTRVIKSVLKLQICGSGQQRHLWTWKAVNTTVVCDNSLYLQLLRASSSNKSFWWRQNLRITTYTFAWTPLSGFPKDLFSGEHNDKVEEKSSMKIMFIKSNTFDGLLLCDVFYFGGVQINSYE